MAPNTPNDMFTLSAVPSAVASAAASAVGTPASLPPLDAEEREKSIKVSLADLTAKATALYQQKKYDEATEVFAHASEMQAEFNGEMSPENADILFMYGRSLFKVGQSKSDVLGGKASGEATKKKKKKANGAAKSAAKGSTEETAASGQAGTEAEDAAQEIVEEKVAILAEKASGSEAKEGQETKKPLFQFTGDENFEDSDEDSDEDDEDEGDEEEEDDLAVSFEVLDLARVLFEKTLEQANADTEGKGKEKAEGDTPNLRHIKERLGDTHDLLNEISLENEEYPVAINDARAALKYKSELYPEESDILAEAHYKLSLSLEFASVTQSGGENKEGPKVVDEDLRNEAASELEKAIASTKLKLQNMEIGLVESHAPEDNDIIREKIADLKDVLGEMESRLVDLKKPPVDVESMLGTANPMSGLLGAALGESATDKEARVQEAKKNAKDLSGLVRKKDKKPESTSEDAAANGGKRKAEGDLVEGGDDSKKAKVEEDSPMS